MNGTKTENVIAKECFLLLGALPVRKVKNLKCVIFKDKKANRTSSNCKDYLSFILVLNSLPPSYTKILYLWTIFDTTWYCLISQSLYLCTYATLYTRVYHGFQLNKAR